jgi:DNA adenine methylase
MNTSPSRPALRYFGGKWNLAPWIISHFPPHVAYVEPFGGGASVLLRKPVSFVEVYNDLNSRVVNFFRVLRENTVDLMEMLTFTPYSREEYELAHHKSDDPVEDARRFVVLSGQGNRGAGTIDAGGWRWMKNANRAKTNAHDWTNMDHLMQIAQRFDGVQVENDDAFNVLQRYDSKNTLFYVDPPYLASTRCMRWQGDAYECELANNSDHERLAQALHDLSGMVVLSGYPSDLYNRLYADWRSEIKIVTMRVRSERGKGKPTQECIWISPNCRTPQISLFVEKVVEA